MSDIIVVWHGEEPPTPATNQHPDAVRYKIRDNYVDAIGGKPTEKELDLYLNPPPTAEQIARESALSSGKAKLKALGLTETEIDALRWQP